MSKTPIKIAKAFYAAFLRGDKDALLELLDPEVVFEFPELPGVPLRKRYSGHRGFLRLWKDREAAIQYTSFEPSDFLEKPGMAIVLGATRGRNIKSKRTFRFAWVEIFDVRRGRIVRFRELIDPASICRAFADA